MRRRGPTLRFQLEGLARSAIIVVLGAGGVVSCLATGNPNGPNGQGRETTADAGPGLFGEDSGACASQFCAPLECGPETRAMPLPGECCRTVCEPSDCSLKNCPPLDCASGTHPEKPSGLCCATCVRNPKSKTGETCEQGQAGYLDFLDQTMSTLGAAFCQADGDCRIVKIDNPCEHGCGTALAARSSGELKSRLGTYAATHCSACEASSPGCPPVERAAYCAGGVCSVH